MVLRMRRVTGDTYSLPHGPCLAVAWHKTRFGRVLVKTWYCACVVLRDTFVIPLGLARTEAWPRWGLDMYFSASDLLGCWLKNLIHCSLTRSFILADPCGLLLRPRWALRENRHVRWFWNNRFQEPENKYPTFCKTLTSNTNRNP